MQKTIKGGKKNLKKKKKETSKDKRKAEVINWGLEKRAGPRGNSI